MPISFRGTVSLATIRIEKDGLKMYIPRSHAKHTALNGALIFILLPYRNILTTALISELERIVNEPCATWDESKMAFCILMGATLAIECHDEDNQEAQALADFFTATRGATTLEKWEAFQTCASEDTLALWWEAYQATRHVKSE